MGHRPVASTYDKAWVGRVLDAVDASVVVVDSRFVVEVWNEGTEQLYGWSAAEALGKPVVELIPPGQFEEGWSAESALDHALKHSVWQGEVVQTARDGTEFAANVMFRPITDEQDDIVGYVTVSRDITDLRKVQIDRAEMNAEVERLQELVRAKDQVVATVSHELRTPLTAVAGFAELLREGGSALAADDRQQMVEDIVDQATDLTTIVEDLLVATQAQLGKLTITQVPVNLTAQLAQVLETLEPEAMERVETELGPGYALGDPARVRQILRNLITNALRYGGPNITVRVTADVAHATVTVADDGAGISPEDRERVFEAFGRATGEPHRRDSVGLGLSVSRNLARAMSGEVTYRYETDRSVFDLTLPAARPPPNEEGSPQQGIRHKEWAFQTFRDLFEPPK